jgi:pyruvate formate lyase activating enzyme
MRCDFCQNYSISQRTSSGYDLITEPSKLVADAETALNNIGIAFTYNEPVIWFEFIRDVSKLARKKGMKTVLVSNGFVNHEPLDEYISFTDAFSIDLKAFNDEFYKKYTGASLYPVKEAIKRIAGSGRHIELTTLVIPGLNDNEEEMENEAAWIASELGKDVPLHLSRYFPMYKREDPSTPVEKLVNLAAKASKYLNYVYVGNSSETNRQDTLCPVCGKRVVKRSGYNIKITNLDKKGRCRECGTTIFRHFTSFSSLIQN